LDGPVQRQAVIVAKETKKKDAEAAKFQEKAAAVGSG